MKKKLFFPLFFSVLLMSCRDNKSLLLSFSNENDISDSRIIYTELKKRKISKNEIIDSYCNVKSMDAKRRILDLGFALESEAVLDIFLLKEWKLLSNEEKYFLLGADRMISLTRIENRYGRSLRLEMPEDNYFSIVSGFERWRNNSK